MEKQKFLTIAIIALLLLNLSTLGVLWLRQGTPPVHPPIPPHELISREVGLSPDQEDLYAELRKHHRKSMDSLDRHYQAVLKEYFDLLINNHITTPNKTTIEQTLGSITSTKASITFKHFEDLDRLLSPSQSARFKKILPQVLEQILDTRKKRPHPPEGIK